MPAPETATAIMLLCEMRRRSMWPSSIRIDEIGRARVNRLGTLLKPAFAEQWSNRPLLYGHFGRVPVVATTERAASGGFGRNPAKRKCLKS